MGAWVHGCMGAWMHGCMGAWVHGCMYAWWKVYVDIYECPGIIVYVNAC